MHGFQPAGDFAMLLVPDLDTLTIDAAVATDHGAPPVVALICDVRDPIDGGDYRRDPRAVIRRAEAFLREAGPRLVGADEARFAAAVECYAFDSVRFEQRTQSAFYEVDSAEGAWNAPGGPLDEIVAQPRVSPRLGYGVAPPLDASAQLRWEIAQTMRAVGVPARVSHHAGGGAGQLRVAPGATTPARAADAIQWSRHVVRNVARSQGSVGTFMPLPLHGDRGSGMPVRQSLSRNGWPLFFDTNGYAGLSQLGRFYAGGLLAHGAALMAFTSPSTNSYRRFAGDASAPSFLAFSSRAGAAGVRVPVDSLEPEEKQVEFVLADGTANPYLAIAAMLLAGIDGIARGIDPSDPLEQAGGRPSFNSPGGPPPLPRSLGEALDALDGDRDFLLRGDVFESEFIDEWIDLKRAEVRELEAHPAPYEFELYFDG
jgi:glutamine synthetase